MKLFSIEPHTDAVLTFDDWSESAVSAVVPLSLFDSMPEAAVDASVPAFEFASVELSVDALSSATMAEASPESVVPGFVIVVSSESEEPPQDERAEAAKKSSGMVRLYIFTPELTAGYLLTELKRLFATRNIKLITKTTVKS